MKAVPEHPHPQYPKAPELQEGANLAEILELYVWLRNILESEGPEIQEYVKGTQDASLTARAANLKSKILAFSITPRCTLFELMSFVKDIDEFMDDYESFDSSPWFRHKRDFFWGMPRKMEKLNHLVRAYDLPLNGDNQVGHVTDLLGAYARRQMELLPKGDFGNPHHIEVGGPETSQLQRSVRIALGLPDPEEL